MSWVVRNIKWIMLISGVLTCTMLYAAIAPNAALEFMFGETLQGPLAEIVVRNWGMLIGAVGLMLIYGAFNAHVRKLVVVVALSSKLAFIGLIFAFGANYLSKTGASILFDAAVIVLFVMYLVGVEGEGRAAKGG